MLEQHAFLSGYAYKIDRDVSGQHTQTRHPVPEEQRLGDSPVAVCRIHGMSYAPVYAAFDEGEYYMSFYGPSELPW